jgi:hypothetical protein
VKRHRALTLLSDHKPAWIADAFNPAIPNCLTVRKHEGGHPFSIQLDNVEPENDEHGEELDNTFRILLDEAEKVLLDADPVGE